MSQTRMALASTLRVDFDNLTPITGAIRALPVVVCVVLGFTIDGSRGAIALAIGANLIALLSLFGRPGLPLKMAVFDTIGIGVAVFLGSATGAILWLHLVTLLGVCFMAGMLVAVGTSQGTAGIQAIIAFLVLGRFSAHPRGALALAGLVMLGAAIETGALVLLRVPPSLRVQRARLADAFDALATITQRDPTRSHIDLTTIIDGAERALRSPGLFGRSDVQDLRAILDQAKRARRQLTAIAGLRARLSEVGRTDEAATVDDCLVAASSTFQAISDGLRHPARRSEWRAFASLYATTVAALDSQTRTDHELTPNDEILLAQCVRYFAALGGQLRAAGGLLDGPTGQTRPRPRTRSTRDRLRFDLDRLADDTEAITSNLTWDSPVFRHAIRLSIAVPFATLLATWAGIPRAYWVPYAVAVILKPDYTTLLSRGLGRAIGVLFGATIAAAMVATVHPGLPLTTVLIGLAAWAAYASWGASFSIAIGFDTAFLLLLLSTALPDTVGTAADRFLDIVVGGVIALLAYLLWPSPPRAGVDEALADLFAKMSDYLSIVFSLLEGAPVEVTLVKARSRASRQAWANAQAAVGRSVAEPHAIAEEATTDRSLLTAALRIARVTHALRIEAELGATIATSAAFRDLIDGCLDAMVSLSHSLAEKSTIAVFVDLRWRCTQVEAILGNGDHADALRLHLDELVNAIDTALFVVTADESSPS
jgi:uncharacterized membrane protein YccC